MKSRNRPTRASRLGSAECARRAGTTVRALRIYERRGLLSPPRNANGWRSYGEAELRRLHDITTLKGLGLTLREIREVLDSPGARPLEAVLRIQLESWEARKVAAEHALKLVRSALSRLAAGHEISVDELCELARSNEMTDSHQLLRDLINESIDPVEEREYLTWWSRRPRADGESMRTFSEAQRPIFEAIERLRVKGARPESVRVQGLLERQASLMLEHGVREQMVALMDWNPVVARKWMQVGERHRDKSLSARPRAAGPYGKALRDFIAEAARASPAGRALAPIYEEARSCLARKIAAGSAEGRALGRRFAALCKASRLGDPATFALFTAHLAEPAHQTAYRFLAAAVSRKKIAR